MRKWFRALAVAALLLGAVPSTAQEINWSTYQDLAVQKLIQYLQINTTNPPGNELKAAHFFQQWFESEGIPVQVFEFAPGRADLVARLKGDGSRPALILANHMDVVSSDPARWRVDPFSATVLDGDIYGRGALDMKGLGLVEAVVLVMLKREGVPLHRDVLFVATSDEEVDMKGAQWLIDNKRDLLAGAEYLITEGGQNLVEDGKIKFFGVDNAEKTPFWLTVTAHGKPGHGSRPRWDSAPNRLVHGLARVADWETPLTVLPGVEKFFRDLAAHETGKRAEEFRDVRAALADPAFRAEMTGDEAYNYLFRNTVSVTMLRGSKQTNVIPGEASANLDVRLLPGQDPDDFLTQLKKVLADDTLEVKMAQDVFRPANSSPADTELFKTIEAVVVEHYPGAIVTTRMLSGFTESNLFRRVGIDCYGFEPFLLTREETATVHGDNERISEKNVRDGVKLLYEVVDRMVH